MGLSGVEIEVIAKLCLPLIEENDLVQTALTCRLFFQLLEKKMAVYWIVTHKRDLTYLEEQIERKKRGIEIELKREFQRRLKMVNGYNVFAKIQINEMKAMGVPTNEMFRTCAINWNKLCDDDKKVFSQMAVEQNQEELNKPKPVPEEELLDFESKKQETIERLTSEMSEKEALLLEFRRKFDYRMRLLTG